MTFEHVENNQNMKYKPGRISTSATRPAANDHQKELRENRSHCPDTVTNDCNTVQTLAKDHLAIKTTFYFS